MENKQPYSNPHNAPQDAHGELEALSPLLAKVNRPQVPLPPDSYFEALADTVLTSEKPTAQRKRIFRMVPMGMASLAAAACIVLAIMLWPSETVTDNSTVALDALTDEELVQLALQDDALLDARMLEDDSLVMLLAANEHFQYLQEPAAENEEYNKLLFELIDDETLMEDWL